MPMEFLLVGQAAEVSVASAWAGQAAGSSRFPLRAAEEQKSRRNHANQAPARRARVFFLPRCMQQREVPSGGVLLSPMLRSTRHHPPGCRRPLWWHRGVSSAVGAVPGAQRSEMIAHGNQWERRWAIALQAAATRRRLRGD
jgi:hypothetical protein